MSTSPQSEVTIEGQLYSGQDSSRRHAILRSAAGVVLIDAGDTCLRLSPDDVEISPRIGNTPRYLHLPDDAVFETEDNAGVDHLAAQSRGGGGNRLLHRLENHLGLILAAVLITLATTGIAFVWGVPWTAQVVANALPDSVAEQVGKSTLGTLDNTWLEPSSLPELRQQSLQAHFRPLLKPVAGQDLEVVFRSSPAIGANAMALPDGTLIFTDDLVNLAGDDDELTAILAHEIGHVAHRHGMKGMVQSSLTFWLIVMMTGDLSAFSDATVAVPAVLMSLSYSRDMEREADTFALQTLKANDIDPIHFANIMERLLAAHGEGDAMETEGESNRWDSLEDMLSSHPVTGERIERFKQSP
ncbi:MAG: M48 family metallopeptidase [Marinobacter sp.]|uniref:M48 family metallopeptidase n=1 Tax=Marinobacter sp. TaxID=50741 RepID=UPI00329759A4